MFFLWPGKKSFCPFWGPKLKFLKIVSQIYFVGDCTLRKIFTDFQQKMIIFKVSLSLSEFLKMKTCNTRMFCSIVSINLCRQWFVLHISIFLRDVFFFCAIFQCCSRILCSNWYPNRRAFLLKLLFARLTIIC